MCHWTLEKTTRGGCVVGSSSRVDRFQSGTWVVSAVPTAEAARDERTCEVACGAAQSALLSRYTSHDNGKASPIFLNTLLIA